MSPLERAARAAAAVYGYSETEWEGLPDVNPVANGDLDKQHFIEIARAVLEAIREPSEGMDSAGVMDGDWNRDNLDLGDEAKKVWQAMIDAALAE